MRYLHFSRASGVDLRGSYRGLTSVVAPMLGGASRSVRSAYVPLLVVTSCSVLRMNDEPKLTRLARVAEAFSPGAPIDSVRLFAGRIELVLDVVTAIRQRGQHVIIYGERGVGKTSLANVLEEVLGGTHDVPRLVVRVNCGTTDTFRSIWATALKEAGRRAQALDEELLSPSAPEAVRQSLEALAPGSLVVIDELDRLEDDEALSLMADTIKTLSDHSTPVTMLLIGVADSVNDLVGDHRSVERALNQIQMPRMSTDELAEIIDNGVAALGMTVEDTARLRIAALSEGLPFYTHLLSLHACQRALQNDVSMVQSGDVDAAVRLAVQKAQHSIKSDYQKATRSPRQESLFEEVLLACALAPKDELGYFVASGVRRPLSQILGKPYDIPAFARHLNAFTEHARGEVLEKTGEPRRFFYRFANPLLQPFVVLNGIAKGRLSEQDGVYGTRE